MSIIKKKFTGLDCILLVDDNKLTNFVHRKAIQKSVVQTQVMDVTNGVDALEFLTYSGKFESSEPIARPGIIFLDINMPGLSGWDFMEQYINLDNSLRAKVIVIMLTTSLDPEDRERAKAHNQIVDFMMKPLRPEMVKDLAEKYFKTEED